MGEGLRAEAQTGSFWRFFFDPVCGLVPLLFEWLPEGWEHVRRCSEGVLLDMVGSEGKVARGWKVVRRGSCSGFEG